MSDQNCPLCGSPQIADETGTRFECGRWIKADWPAPGSARSEPWECDKRRLALAESIIEALISPRVGKEQKRFGFARAKDAARAFLKNRNYYERARAALALALKPSA